MCLWQLRLFPASRRCGIHTGVLGNGQACPTPYGCATPAIVAASPTSGQRSVQRSSLVRGKEGPETESGHQSVSTHPQECFRACLCNLQPREGRGGASERGRDTAREGGREGPEGGRDSNRKSAYAASPQPPVPRSSLLLRAAAACATQQPPAPLSSRLRSAALALTAAQRRLQQ